MKLGVSAIAALLMLLTACRPADQKVKSVKERLEAGEIVEFTEPGYRRPSCRQQQPDWQDVRVSDENERMRIVVGKQNSALNPGTHSCFRVGSQIKINSPGDKGNKGGGLVTLSKLSLVMIDKLEKYHLKGRYFQSSDDFFKYKDNMKMRLRPDHNGIVTVLEFAYVKGTATDEKNLQQKDTDQSSGDGFQETLNEGDSISKCNKPWSDLIVPEIYKSALMSGKLQSYYNWGSRNCLIQGQDALVKANFGAEFPSYAKIKVLKVKLVRAAFIDAKFLVASGDYDLGPLKKQIQLENKEEFITIVDFKVEGAPQGQETSGTIEQKPEQNPSDDELQCLPANALLTAVRTTPDQIVGDKTRFTVMISGNACQSEGDLAKLMISEDGKIVKLAVRVLSASFNKELGSTELIVERLAVLGGE